MSKARKLEVSFSLSNCCVISLRTAGARALKVGLKITAADITLLEFKMTALC